ncbi:hypothetical protein [Nonomuraea sp. NPDC049158]|uniref:hypothetical protein n=1 Tax=Nonomuraea sp. NPDC049158 TaxID=3155649 RepID=UPI0033E8233E
MDNPRNGIAGFRLTEHTWNTELGNWIDAISPDGRRAGALLFDPKIIGMPGVRERVVATVLTDQRLVLGGLAGLIPVADVVAAGEQVWLLTAQAVSPTLSDLLASGAIDASGAAAVLAETAQTLLALHAAGVTHGSVHPGSVVITADGAALLSERGLSDAIRGQVSPPERDVAAWASLARALAASVTRSAPRAAALFERAAVTTTTHGLGTARSVVLSEPTALPGGALRHEGLAQAARGRSAFAHPPVAAQPPLDESDIVTLLAVPGPHQAPVHFGPGVSSGVSTESAQAGTTAERIWREGREQVGTVQRGGKPGKAARARRRRTILSAVLFAVIMGGAILAWLKLSGAPELAIKSIDVVAPKKPQGCDSAVVVTGKIVTNGEAGEISYEWRKNLDKEVVKQTLRTTADQTSYTVPLRWTLKGKSTVKATATLRVLSPGPLRTDKASFTYKC